MIRSILILISVICSNGDDHDFKLAHYELSRNDDEIELHVTIDRFDFLQAVALCSQNKELSACMSEYLKMHFRLSFNGMEKEYEYLGHEITADFVEIDFTFGSFPQKIEEIDVFNDVLLEQYKEQENIVVSRFHDRKRSFRLNKGRIETTIKY